MGSLMGALSRVIRRDRLAALNRLLFGDRRDPRRVLAEKFGVEMPVSGSPPRVALDWARRTLEAHQIDVSREPFNAIRVLRRQKPLGLATTRYLVVHLRNYR